MDKALVRVTNAAGALRAARLALDQGVRDASRAGTPLRAISRAAGVSHQRVSQILKTRQHDLEAYNGEFIFRAVPEQPGVIDVFRLDGSKDGAALAWPGTRIVALEGVPNGVRVHTARRRGIITRNMKGYWTLSRLEPGPPGPQD